MVKSQIVCICLATVALCTLPVRGEDAWGRLTADKLEAVHQAVVKLQADRKTIERTGPVTESPANLPLHSSLSHDSRGTIDEIVAAAKAVGTQVVMFTEHP